MRPKVLLRFLVILFLFAGSLGYLSFMAPKYLMALYSAPQVSKVIHDVLRPYLPITTPAEMFLKINQYRESLKLPLFQEESAVCSQSKTNDPSVQNVFALCPTCTHATMLTISQYADSNTLLEQLIGNEMAKATLESATLTHACIATQNEMLLLFFAQKTAIKPETKGSVPLPISTASPTHFSEAELWQALSQYRQAQGRTSLTLDENICVYARKRVQDQIAMMRLKKPEEYPVPDKYPLDAHSGFSADAASGYSFEVTQKNELAENLAYWPAAKSPVHIIEWGWDSSTEGHREAQLSNDWSSACITGDQGFYVAIFGK